LQTGLLLNPCTWIFLFPTGWFSFSPSFQSFLHLAGTQLGLKVDLVALRRAVNNVGLFAIKALCDKAKISALKKGQGPTDHPPICPG
jgi:hypothetical protein